MEMERRHYRLHNPFLEKQWTLNNPILGITWLGFKGLQGARVELDCHLWVNGGVIKVKATNQTKIMYKNMRIAVVVDSYHSSLSVSSTPYNLPLNLFFL